MRAAPSQKCNGCLGGARALIEGDRRHQSGPGWQINERAVFSSRPSSLSDLLSRSRFTPEAETLSTSTKTS